MKRLDLNTTNKFLSILVVGIPGSGKTTFLGSAALDPRSAPVLHVDASGNPESLLRLKAQPDVVRLGKLTDLDAVFDFFLSGQPANHALVTQFGCVPGYKTLVLDGITAIQRKSFEQVMGYVTGSPGKGVPKPEWDHYDRSLSQMLEIATLAFQRLTNIHVLVSCLERTDIRYMFPEMSKEKDKGPYPYHKPALRGQAQRELPGEAKCVIRLSHISNMPIEKVKELKADKAYCIGQFVQSKNAYAKDQHGFGVDFMANPTITQLLNILEAHEQARKLSQQK